MFDLTREHDTNPTRVFTDQGWALAGFGHKRVDSKATLQETGHKRVKSHDSQYTRLTCQFICVNLK